MSILASTRSGFTEFFTLRRQSAEAAQVAPAVRQSVVSELRLSKQKHEAAEALWSAGFSAEALHLAKDAYLAALRASEVLGKSAAASSPSPAAPTSAPAAEAIGTDAAADGTGSDGSADGVVVAPAAVTSAAVTTAHARAAPFAGLHLNAGALAVLRDAEQYSRAELPRFDDAVRSTHQDAYRSFLDARVALDVATSGYASTPREIGMRRIKRWSLVTLGVLMLGSLAVWRVMPRQSISADASAHWGDASTSDANNAVDGVEGTEWSLPDATAGWIDLHLSPGRSIKAVELLNGRNASWNDRAIREYQLEAFSGGRVVARGNGQFATMEGPPAWVRVPLAAQNVERIRITVKSWHAKGGALAEARVVEDRPE